MRRIAVRLRSLWRGLRHGAGVSAEMREEMRFHIEEEAARRVREHGLDAAEARRCASISFGGVEQYADEGRRARGLGVLSGLNLDFRLGARMLVKYPGLTLVGGLAMAFAICVGAATFEFLTQAFRPSIPLPGGDRIVGIRTWDAAASRTEWRVLHDFDEWRDRVESIDDIGVFRLTNLNLALADGGGAPVRAAEISASGFRTAGVAPQLGRTLVEEDERSDAAHVVVLGHDVWQQRFGAAADVVGSTIRLDGIPHTVVGVMPHGYAFPVAEELWVPLRLNALHYGPREGPPLRVFGRLAAGVTMGEAQAELNTVASAAALASPETHEHLRLTVMEHAHAILGTTLYLTELASTGAIAAVLPLSVNLLIMLFLVLICGNVALLMFARAATRESEIVVRNALGASRTRIVAQLFAEALVLGIVAAVIGVAAAGSLLRWGLWIVRTEFLEGVPLPFWFDGAISPGTVLYACALTVVAAGVAGVLPALKVTRGLGQRLRAATAGGGFRFGGVWTVVIVSQIALTIPFPAVLFALRGDAAAIAAVDTGLADHEFLAVRLELDRHRASDPALGRPRGMSLGASVTELAQHVASNSAVRGVTFANRVPRMYHPYRLIEVDEGPAAPLHPQWPAYRVSSAAVAPDFFDVLGVPILDGRSFHASDTMGSERAIIVNESFVQRVLGGTNAVGRRMRFTVFAESGEPLPAEGEDAPWHEIVGVVRDLGMSYGDFDPKIAGYYMPTAPPAMAPLHMVVHTAGGAAALIPRLPQLAAAADPALRLHDPTTFDRVIENELQFYRFWFWFATALGGVALMLSLAGIYAVMAFTAAQRAREIGIRIALGANRGRLVAGIFRRPLRQVAIGVLTGIVIVAAILLAAGVPVSLASAAALAAYTAVMFCVCMLACIVPTRRALSIEPTEALRTE